MKFQDFKDELCPLCQEVDLDGVLSPDRTAALPAYDSRDAPSWDHYLTVVRQFTLAAVNENAHHCTFCTFLRDLAIRIRRYPVPRASVIAANDSSVADGDGFVLASVPANLVYSGDGFAATSGPSGRRSDAMFLLVLPGECVLNRIADQVRRNARMTKFVVDIAVQHAKHRGTLTSLPTEEVCQEGSPVQHRLVNPYRVDYAQIRSWIALCSKSHETCKKWAGRPPVPRLKVIDCESRTIVKPKPGLPYAALSYVWGVGAPEKYVYPNLPGDLPNVIEDALSVTRQLGIPYLWVDRFCIWQDDPTQSHKADQINSMGQIYGDAIITIVAAAGGKPSYGLPGVGGGRSLNNQIVGRVRDKTLVADFSWDAQRMILERSRWYSRGWTYQEWVLSTRVLLFTEYRVSFQCLGMECVEHLSHPIAIDDGIRQNTDHTALYKADGASRFLSEFSKRHLTFDGDALNAITGILEVWTASNPGAGHIMGVPIILPSPEFWSDLYLFVALWTGLTWTLATSGVSKAVRRSAMPSWSCLSIQGGSIAIGSRSAMLTDMEVFAEMDGGASVELKDGTVQGFHEFVSSGGLSSPACKHIPAIHLTGWCFKVGPFTKKQREFVLIEAGSPGHELVFIPDLGTASGDAILRNEYEAISPYCPESSRCALVFERTPQGVKRIGVLQLYDWELNEHGDRMVPRTCNPEKVFQAIKGTIRLV